MSDSSPAESRAVVGLLGSTAAKEAFLSVIKDQLPDDVNESSSASSGGGGIVTNFRQMANHPAVEMVLSTRLSPPPDPATKSSSSAGQPTNSDDIIVLVVVEGDAASVAVVEERLGEVDAQPHTPFMLVTVEASVSPGKPSSEEAATHLAGPLARTRDLSSRLNLIERYYGHTYLGDVQSGSANASIASSEATTQATSSPSSRCNAHSLLSMCLNIITSPAHVVWNRQVGQFTPQGHRLFHRAFWILDKDNDGWLNNDELDVWYSTMYEGTQKFELNRDLEALRKHQTGSRHKYLDSQGRVSLSGFLLLSRAALRHGGAPTMAQWCLLASTGVKSDGNPFDSDDLDAARLPSPHSVFQLSHSGVRFFESLYSPSKVPKDGSLWDLVPECPWNCVDGLPKASATTNELSRMDFVNCWRFMATRNPQIVVEFARYWNYTGVPSQLFVEKKTREHRQQQNDFPTTLQVLVIGSRRCGKSSLIRRLTSLQRNQPQVSSSNQGATANSGSRSTSLVPVRMEGGYDYLLAYQELDSEEDTFFVQTAAMAQIDCVLLCYDGSDSFSFSYLEGFFALLKPHMPSLPVVVCLTKVDIPLEDQVSIQSPEIACRQRNLAWPPVLTSAVAGERIEALGGAANQVEDLNETLVEVIKKPDLCRVVREGETDQNSVGPLRLLRRAIIVSLAGIGIYYGGRLLFRQLRGKQE